VLVSIVSTAISVPLDVTIVRTPSARAQTVELSARRHDVRVRRRPRRRVRGGAAAGLEAGQ
jgi:hypothetical protein